MMMLVKVKQRKLTKHFERDSVGKFLGLIFELGQRGVPEEIGGSRLLHFLSVKISSKKPDKACLKLNFFSLRQMVGTCNTNRNILFKPICCNKFEVTGLESLNKAYSC